MSVDESGKFNQVEKSTVIKKMACQSIVMSAITVRCNALHHKIFC